MADADPDHALAELADVILRIARELDPHGAGTPAVVPLTGTEALVLRWIDTHRGASPSALAAATRLQRSNLSAALRSLEAKGMVERRPDPSDARSAQLHPTELATSSIARLRAHWASTVRAALGGDAAAVDGALTLLSRLEHGLATSR